MIATLKIRVQFKMGYRIFAHAVEIEKRCTRTTAAAPPKEHIYIYFVVVKYNPAAESVFKLSLRSS